MNSLNENPILERIQVLDNWLQRNSKKHFQSSVVENERNYYKSQLGKTASTVIETCRTQCYNMIIKKEL